MLYIFLCRTHHISTISFCNFAFVFLYLIDHGGFRAVPSGPTRTCAGRITQGDELATEENTNGHSKYATKLAFFRIELLILSLGTQFQDCLVQTPSSYLIRLQSYEYLCCLFSCISLFFTPYFCLYQFYICGLWPHGPYHVTFCNK